MEGALDVFSKSLPTALSLKEAFRKYVKFRASRFLPRNQDVIPPSPYPSPTRGEGTLRLN